jgi:hypothetical protein
MISPVGVLCARHWPFAFLPTGNDASSAILQGQVASASARPGIVQGPDGDQDFRIMKAFPIRAPGGFRCGNAADIRFRPGDNRKIAAQPQANPCGWLWSRSSSKTSRPRLNRRTTVLPPAETGFWGSHF